MVFREKQMGEMQTVYHDRLQMSFCGQCTLLWKWFGQWKREEKYNKDKKGKWGSAFVCLANSLSFSVHWWCVIGMMKIDSRWIILCVSQCWLWSVPFPPPREARATVSFVKKDCFNCSFQYSGLFPRLAHLKPSCSAHYLSIKAADFLIDKMESNIRKEQSWNHWRKRTILKGKSAQIISLSLLRQQSRIVHLQTIALLIPLQVLSIRGKCQSCCCREL